MRQWEVTEVAFFCTDDDFKLYFDEYGDNSKPAIIFIYDIGCKRSFFKKQTEGLKEDYHVITWDYRAHGMAEHTHKQLNFERLAKDLANLIEHLKLSSVVLAGSGAGGTIILNYIRLFGEKSVEKMILMDASLKEIQTGDWTQGMFKDDREAVDYMKEMTYDWKNFAPGLLGKMFGEGMTVSDEDKNFITGQFLDNNNTLMMSLMVGYITEDNRKTAQEITVPVLLTYGKDADSKHIEKEQAAAGCFANAQIKTFTGGTLHYYLDAEAFNKAVKEFLNKGC